MRTLLLVLFLLAGCSRPTQAALEQVNSGMSPTEVQAILGKPDRVESSETLGLSGLAYFYGKDVRIVFLNKAVLSKTGSFSK